MFNTLKSWFTKTETWGGTRSDSGTFFNTTKETTMKATIQPVGEKFGLFSGGNLVGTYARKRDAVRGATRRELHLINA